MIMEEHIGVQWIIKMVNSKEMDLDDIYIVMVECMMVNGKMTIWMDMVNYSILMVNWLMKDFGKRLNFMG